MTKLASLKMQYSRKKIADKEYCLNRANLMSIKIAHWKSLEQSANIKKERDFCLLMRNIYLKRYIYYLNK